MIAITVADAPAPTVPDSAHLRILHVEDNPSDALLIQEQVKALVPAVTFDHVPRLRDISADVLDVVDCVLLDLSLPDGAGVELVESVRLLRPDVAIVVLTGLDDAPTGVEAVRRGAQDYLVKSHSDGASVERAIRYAVERMRLERLLTRQALHDPLTGLPNRALFADRLDGAVERMRRSGTSFAVMMVDLDHFKNVNDTLGHAVGDALLVQVADRLSTPLRSGDTLCRLGGDEFTVLCENLQTPADAAQLAERLSRVFLKPFDLHPHSVYSAISIGISVSEPDSNPEGMLRDADTALYAAKRGGRGRTAWYNEQLHVEAETRFTLENAMRDALRTGRGFDVAFQSIVDLHTGEVVAIEALARWSHETLGKVPPAQFIPLAESAGLVPSLDLRVLDRALVELTERRAVSPSLRLHVNVSGRTLNSARFERELMQRVDNVDLLPVDITLEILETALLTPAGVGAVERLQQNGFRIALDDFGAGGSSLNHFLTFDADVLKIDRSFIAAAAAGNRRAVSVVRLVAKAGADLGMSVIAEGVEAQAELDMCLELGVRQAQGFLWGVM